MAPKCDGCNKDVAFFVTITCVQCAQGVSSGVCADHLEDPGPLLAFKHKCIEPRGPWRIREGSRG